MGETSRPDCPRKRGEFVAMMKTNIGFGTKLANDFSEERLTFPVPSFFD
jgi:hypothetical protein